MSKSKIRYKIVLASNKIEKGWRLLEQEFPEKMEECKEFLRNNPADRSKAIGVLKKLKGRHKDKLQYDITKNDARVWYQINNKERIVIIKYAGHHPD